MPSGRNVELPDLSARLFASDVGFLSPFIYATLRELSRLLTRHGFRRNQDRPRRSATARLGMA